jgi:hypothetical protein
MEFGTVLLNNESHKTGISQIFDLTQINILHHFYLSTYPYFKSFMLRILQCYFNLFNFGY